MRRKASLVRRGFAWAAGLLAVAVAGIAGLAAALDAGYFREPLIHFIAARTERAIRVDGSLRVHILSFTPRVTAERVSVGNPSWTPPGTTANIEKIVLAFELANHGHSFDIADLEMQGVVLHLIRDPQGRANWQLTDPRNGGKRHVTVIHSLSAKNARVVLDDGRRHLQFDGIVSAGTDSAEPGRGWLRMDGAGQLNGRPATFEIYGDPLAGAARAKPYHFTFAEQSSGSALAGRGSLPHPFNFDFVDATFEASGADLKDLYFLTGVTLINTGRYTLSGKAVRSGTLSLFSDLFARSGQSDMLGSLSIDSSAARSRIEADLHSQLLRISDVGARAAGREPVPKSGERLLLSDASISPTGIRRADAVINFRARRIEVGHIGLTGVGAHISLDGGLLAVAPLTAEVLQGRLVAHVKLDAKTDLPRADFDIKLADLQLAQLEKKTDKPPPLEGLLRARLTGSGRGSSFHQIAATANGTATAVIPHGTMRASLAELMGIDLRGLGLMAAKNTEESPVRCAVASFQAHDGQLTAQTLVLDTAPVLIGGEGTVRLNDETLDLVFRGHPKKVRLLRVRSPILVRGTLAHPSIAIQARNSVAQAAEAVALGVILTPVAAVLAFVDPGLAKDADCAALIDGSARSSPKFKPPEAQASSE